MAAESRRELTEEEQEEVEACFDEERQAFGVWSPFIPAVRRGIEAGFRRGLAHAGRVVPVSSEPTPFDDEGDVVLTAVPAREIVKGDRIMHTDVPRRVHDVKEYEAVIPGTANNGLSFDFGDGWYRFEEEQPVWRISPARPVVEAPVPSDRTIWEVSEASSDDAYLCELNINGSACRVRTLEGKADELLQAMLDALKVGDREAASVTISVCRRWAERSYRLAMSGEVGHLRLVEGFLRNEIEGGRSRERIADEVRNVWQRLAAQAPVVEASGEREALTKEAERRLGVLRCVEQTLDENGVPKVDQSGARLNANGRLVDFFAASTRVPDEAQTDDGRDRQVRGAGSISRGQSGDLNTAPGHAAADYATGPPSSASRVPDEAANERVARALFALHQAHAETPFGGGRMPEWDELPGHLKAPFLNQGMTAVAALRVASRVPSAPGDWALFRCAHDHLFAVAPGEDTGRTKCAICGTVSIQRTSSSSAPEQVERAALRHLIEAYDEAESYGILRPSPEKVAAWERFRAAKADGLAFLDAVSGPPEGSGARVAVEPVAASEIKKGDGVLITGPLGFARKTVFSTISNEDDGCCLNFNDGDSFWIRSRDYKVARVVASGPPEAYDGEICHDCSQPVRARAGSYWKAPDVLWAEVVGDDITILCPLCFYTRANAKGVFIHWEAHREQSGPPESDEREVKLPADLLAVLQDPGVVIRQDAAVFEALARWQRAPAATESPGPPTTEER